MKLSFHIAPISFRGGLKHIQYYIKYKAVLGTCLIFLFTYFVVGMWLPNIHKGEGGVCRKGDVARKWIYITSYKHR
jgi:hypothetical protein